MKLDQCWYKKVCSNDCNSACLRFNLMHQLFEQSNIPEKEWKSKELDDRQDKAAFETLNNMKIDIDLLVEDGANIYICSHVCGNGKTSWAIKLMQNYFDKTWNKHGFNCGGLFLNVPQFFFANKSAISNPDKDFYDLQKKITEVPLVVWDDIASSSLTDYEHNLLLNFIDARIGARKSNIFTSNYADPDKLEELLGQRLFSRVWNSSYIVQLKGNDRRCAEND